jgi:outer membrane protein OmpA-like peptidoglycan-associated protein
LRWLPLLLLAVAALLLLGYCMKRTPDTTQGSNDPASETMAASAPAASVPAAQGTNATFALQPASASAATNSDTGSQATDVASAPSEANANSTADKPELKVFFRYGKAELASDFEDKATDLLAYAKANQSAKFSITGFTDASGKPSLNEVLSRKRAEAVRNALVSDGIDGSRFSLDKPVEDSASADTGEQARRVEVHVAP